MGDDGSSPESTGHSTPERSTRSFFSESSFLSGSVKADSFLCLSDQERDTVLLDQGYVIDNRFKVRQLLGMGGMGIVYLVLDQFLSVERALKVMLPSMVDTPRAERFFLDEIKNLGKISNRGVVRIFECGKEAETNRTYFLMEYIRGKTLSAVLGHDEHGNIPDSRLPLSAHAAVNYILEILMALSEAHRVVIHRDLKPQNIMMREDGSLVILDFGLAKNISSAQQKKSLDAGVGTPHYMSPEQWRKDSLVGIPSDLYSVGVILYEMLTNKRPQGKFVPASQVNSTVPTKLDSVILKCLDPKPEQRYNSAQDLRVALKRAMKKDRPHSSLWKVWVGIGMSITATVLCFLWYQNPIPMDNDAIDRSDFLRPSSPVKEAKIAQTKLAVTEAKEKGQLLSALDPANETAETQETTPSSIPSHAQYNTQVAEQTQESVEPEVVASVTPPKNEVPTSMASPDPQLTNWKIETREDTLYVLCEIAPGPMKNRKVGIYTYFFDEKGRPIGDTDGVNRAPDGQVILGSTEALRNDTQSPVYEFTMPLRQLERLVPGDHILNADIIVWDYTERPIRRILKTEKRPFTVTLQEKHIQRPSPKNTPEPLTERDFDGISFIWIPRGQYLMGSPDGSDQRDEQRRHPVTITRGFWMGKHEVTRAQWANIMGEKAPNPSNADEPQDYISWNDCQVLLQKLNMGGATYRLPTEAEWEYACRAGTTTLYSFGSDAEDLSTFAWHLGSKVAKPQPATGKVPNPWGLHGMHGNVSEWCSDHYQEYYYNISPPEDPPGPNRGDGRVVRGGSWTSVKVNCRSANRNFKAPERTYRDVGLRLVREGP